MQIDGSRILVTGASSGIGAALAALLAARGATVGLVARREDRLQEVLAACRGHAPATRGTGRSTSATSSAPSRSCSRRWDAFGGVDCLVNNAGIPKRTPVPRLTPSDVAHVMDVNFHAPVRMTLALLPRWLERGAGCVVNVSSLGGRLPIAHEAAYCASKFALCGWSEAMAVDLHGTGVEVKLMLPGPIDTEIWDQPDNDPAAFQRAVRARGRLRRRHRRRASRATASSTTCPAEFPGGVGPQHDMVVNKTDDTDAFVAMMGSMGAA